MAYTKMFFGIENHFPPVEGVDDGQRWNGWYCPIFTLENVLKVCNTCNQHATFEEHLANECDWDWYFVNEEGTPSYRRLEEDGTWSTCTLFPCRLILDVAYYGVSTHEWCWEAWETLEEFYKEYPGNRPIV